MLFLIFTLHSYHIYSGPKFTFKMFGFFPKDCNSCSIKCHSIQFPAIKMVAFHPDLQCTWRLWIYQTDYRESSSFLFSPPHAHHSVCMHTYLATQHGKGFTFLTSTPVRDTTTATCPIIWRDKKWCISASSYNSANGAHHVTNELALVCPRVILRILQHTWRSRNKAEQSTHISAVNSKSLKQWISNQVTHTKKHSSTTLVIILQCYEVIRQGVVPLHWKKAGLD